MERGVNKTLTNMRLFNSNLASLKKTVAILVLTISSINAVNIPITMMLTMSSWKKTLLIIISVSIKRNIIVTNEAFKKGVVTGYEREHVINKGCFEDNIDKSNRNKDNDNIDDIAQLESVDRDPLRIKPLLVTSWWMRLSIQSRFESSRSGWY